jgi:hypothetical protein
MTTQEFLDISNEREAQRFGPNVVALRVPELEQLRKSYGACSFSGVTFSWRHQVNGVYNVQTPGTAMDMMVDFSKFLTGGDGARAVPDAP